jgi:predicted alpha/beta hydrolase
MNFLSKIKTHYFFEILRPITHFIYGYTAVKRFGIMEDLPKNITNTWRDWCSVPNYFFNEKYSSTTSALGYYNELTFPIKMLWADDDYIVTQPNVTSFWKNVKSTGGIEITKISPNDFGLKEIGHFGFFRKKFKEKLWPIGLNAINNFL